MKKKTNANKKFDGTESVASEFEWVPEKAERVQQRRTVTAQDLDPRNTKVKITIYIDLDILSEFKQCAAKPNAAPYQTQINNALRSFLAGKKELYDHSNLLNDERFIEAVAKKVARKR
jgi:uncharacterized protein (DUF4415 family)